MHSADTTALAAHRLLVGVDATSLPADYSELSATVRELERRVETAKNEYAHALNDQNEQQQLITARLEVYQRALFGSEGEGGA